MSYWGGSYGARVHRLGPLGCPQPRRSPPGGPVPKVHLEIFALPKRTCTVPGSAGVVLYIAVRHSYRIIHLICNNLVNQRSVTTTHAQITTFIYFLDGTGNPSPPVSSSRAGKGKHSQ